MTIARRSFVRAAAAPLFAMGGCRAVALDAFTVFDPRPIAARAEELFPGKGSALVDLWRTRQFEYTWLRTLTGSYAPFDRVTAEALDFACETLRLEGDASSLLEGFRQLKAWPDAADALGHLKEKGYRLVFLSNFSEKMLNDAIASSSLDRKLFETHLSTDRVRAFKPHPNAYRMALESLGLRRDQIMFAAFAGWDAAGAKSFGLPTFWVNRMRLPRERLAASADASGEDLLQLAEFVSRR